MISLVKQLSQTARVALRVFTAPTKINKLPVCLVSKAIIVAVLQLTIMEGLASLVFRLFVRLDTTVKTEHLFQFLVQSALIPVVKALELKVNARVVHRGNTVKPQV